MPENMKLSTSFLSGTQETKCHTHGHFCLIFGNIVIFTNSSTLIAKIVVAKLNYCVKKEFWSISL